MNCTFAFLGGIAVIACIAAGANAAAGSVVGPQTSAGEIIAVRGGGTADERMLIFDRTTSPATVDRVTVAIGPDYVHAADGGIDRIYDFKLRRIIIFDAKGNLFTNVSLYASAAGRFAELNNRIMLRNMLLAAKMEPKQLPAPLDLFWAGSELGASAGGAPMPELTSQSDSGGSMHFSYAGDDVADFTPASGSLSSEERDGFLRWLRQSSGLHPTIIAAIGKSGRLPQTLSYVRIVGSQRSKIEYRLVTTSRRKASFPLPASAKAQLVPSDDTSDEASAMRALSPIMLEAIAGRFDHGPKSVATFRSAIDQAMKSGDGLSAFVLLVELALQHGAAATACAPPSTSGTPCHSAQEIVALARRDPGGAAYLEAAQQERADPQRAADLLGSIARDKLTNGYVIGVAMANDMLTAMSNSKDQKGRAGQMGDAFALLQAGIHGNPYSAPYYKDLGDYFLHMYRTDLAWLCYDLGRALPERYTPGILDAIDAYEQQLVAAAPDLF